MNAIQELFKNSASWTTVIFVVLVLFFEKFGVKTKRIIERENFEKRVNKLEQRDEKQYEKLNELCNSINDIKTTIIKNEEERKSDVVASYRSTLYRLYETFMKNGYVTSSGLKTEVMSLPIENQEE